MARPRKPTARHLLDGTARKDRLNPAEPQYPVGVPPKPDSIAGRPIASAAWDYIVPIMVKERTLSPAYHAALEMYCLCYADACQWEAKMLKARADKKRAALQRIVTNARKELRQWATQLGLTGASAGKVSSAPPAKEESPLAQLEAKRAKLLRIK